MRRMREVWTDVRYDFTPEQLAWREEARAFLREHRAFGVRTPTAVGLPTYARLLDHASRTGHRPFSSGQEWDN